MGLQEVSSIKLPQPRLIVTVEVSEVLGSSCKPEWGLEMRYSPCYGRYEVPCTIHPCFRAPSAISAAAGFLRCSSGTALSSSSSGYRYPQNCCYCPEQGMTQNHRKSTPRVVLGLEGGWERRAKRYDSIEVEDTCIPAVTLPAGGRRGKVVHH